MKTAILINNDEDEHGIWFMKNIYYRCQEKLCHVFQLTDELQPEMWFISVRELYIQTLTTEECLLLFSFPPSFLRSDEIGRVQDGMAIDTPLFFSCDTGNEIHDFMYVRHTLYHWVTCNFILLRKQESDMRERRRIIKLSFLFCLVFIALMWCREWSLSPLTYKVWVLLLAHLSAAWTSVLRWKHVCAFVSEPVHIYLFVN